MPHIFILIIDVCIALLLLGAVNIWLFDITVAILIPPVIVIAVVVAVWLWQRLQLRK